MYSELGPLSLKVNIRKWKKSASEKENTFLLEEIRLYYKFNLLISNSFLTVCFWVLTWACGVCITRHDLTLDEWNSPKLTVLNESRSHLPLLGIVLSQVLACFHLHIRRLCSTDVSGFVPSCPSSGEAYQNCFGKRLVPSSCQWRAHALKTVLLLDNCKSLIAKR